MPEVVVTRLDVDPISPAARKVGEAIFQCLQSKNIIINADVFWTQFQVRVANGFRIISPEGIGEEDWNPLNPGHRGAIILVDEHWQNDPLKRGTGHLPLREELIQAGLATSEAEIPISEKGSEVPLDHCGIDPLLQATVNVISRSYSRKEEGPDVLALEHDPVLLAKNSKKLGFIGGMANFLTGRLVTRMWEEETEPGGAVWRRTFLSSLLLKAFGNILEAKCPDNADNFGYEFLKFGGTFMTGFTLAASTALCVKEILVGRNKKLAALGLLCTIGLMIPNVRQLLFLMHEINEYGSFARKCSGIWDRFKHFEDSRNLSMAMELCKIVSEKRRNVFIFTSKHHTIRVEHYARRIRKNDPDVFRRLKEYERVPGLMRKQGRNGN